MFGGAPPKPKPLLGLSCEPPKALGAGAFEPKAKFGGEAALAPKLNPPEEAGFEAAGVEFEAPKAGGGLDCWPKVLAGVLEGAPPN